VLAVVLARPDGPAIPEPMLPDALAVPHVIVGSDAVAALDAATGRELWRYDPEVWRAGQPSNGTGFVHRGVATWTDGRERRVFINARWKLVALDARTGAPIAGFGERGEEIIEIAAAVLTDAHRRRGHPHQPQANTDNHAGQSQPRNGGSKQLWPLVLAGTDDVARRQHQVDPGEVIAETADAIVVLAMYVVGDSAAQSGECRAGCRRNQPAAGQKNRHQIFEGHPRLRFQEAGIGIESEHPIETPRQDHASLRVERGVAIGTAGTMRNPATIGRPFSETLAQF